MSDVSAILNQVRYDKIVRATKLAKLKLPAELQNAINARDHMKELASQLHNARNALTSETARRLADGENPDTVLEDAGNRVNRIQAMEAMTQGSTNLVGRLNRTIRSRYANAQGALWEQIAPRVHKAVEVLEDNAPKLPVELTAEAVLEAGRGEEYKACRDAAALIDTYAVLATPNRLGRLPHGAKGNPAEWLHLYALPHVEVISEGADPKDPRRKPRAAVKKLGAPKFQLLVQVARGDLHGVTLDITNDHDTHMKRLDILVKANKIIPQPHGGPSTHLPMQ